MFSYNLQKKCRMCKVKPPTDKTFSDSATLKSYFAHLPQSSSALGAGQTLVHQREHPWRLAKKTHGYIRYISWIYPPGWQPPPRNIRSLVGNTVPINLFM